MAVHDGQIRRLVINIPPRTAKSTITSVMWPAWTWIHRPAFKWLCGSYALKLAIRDALKMRRLIQSSWFRDRWGREFNLTDDSDWGEPKPAKWGDPYGFELTDDQNQKMRFENDRTGYRIAFGFEGGVMGDGGDCCLVDDPHDRKKANSDVERETDLVTFREAISTRLNNPITSSIVIVMQRLHVQDLSALALSLGYEHLLLPMHYDPARSKVTCIGYKDPRTTAGELLHPARFDEKAVTEWEATLLSAAAGQLEQTPAPPGGEVFERDWWRFYDEEPEAYDVELQSWDLAFKGKETSNYVAGQAWGKVGANCYLKPDEVYKQMNFPTTLEEFRAFSKSHPYSQKLVEDKANGPALIDSLKSEIPGIWPVPNQGGAEAVARSVAPYVKAGNVWLPNPYTVRADADGRVPSGSTVNQDRRWVLRFIDNAATFPKGSIPPGSHGDDVVAMSQAVHHLMHGSPKVWFF